MRRPVPPKIKSAHMVTPGFFAGTILAAAILGAGAIVFFFNPGTHRFYPACQFHQLTGLNCPGCGATRAFYALLHGNFLLALKDNALFVISFFGGTLWSAIFAIQKRRRPKMVFNLPTKWIWIFAAVAIAFAILRNLPAFSFLAP